METSPSLQGHKMREGVTPPPEEDKNLIPSPCRLHTSFSIVVDEAEPTMSPSPTPPLLARSPSPTFHVDEVDDGGEPRKVCSKLTKQKSDERLRQIKGEVENRRSEFARLLEEHAQVVAQLKAMEASSAATPV